MSWAALNGSTLNGAGSPSWVKQAAVTGSLGASGTASATRVLIGSATGSASVSGTATVLNAKSAEATGTLVAYGVSNALLTHAGVAHGYATVTGRALILRTVWAEAAGDCTSSGYAIVDSQLATATGSFGATGSVGAGGSAGVAYTLLTSQTPGGAFNDGPYEMGLAFSTTEAGTITKFRYYKESGESGSHTGHLWSADGTLLASAAFTGETSSGWQEATLSPPYLISANTKYVVSVNANTNYGATSHGLDATITHGPITSALSGVTINPNGFYGTAGTFPTSTFHNGNYFRDAEFTTISFSPEPHFIFPGRASGSLSITASSVNALVTRMTLTPSLGFFGAPANKCYAEASIKYFGDLHWHLDGFAPTRDPIGKLSVTGTVLQSNTKLTVTSVTPGAAGARGSALAHKIYAGAGHGNAGATALTVSANAIRAKMGQAAATASITGSAVGVVRKNATATGEFGATLGALTQIRMRYAGHAYGTVTSSGYAVTGGKGVSAAATGLLTIEGVPPTWGIQHKATAKGQFGASGKALASLVYQASANGAVEAGANHPIPGIQYHAEAAGRAVVEGSAGGIMVHLAQAIGYLNVGVGLAFAVTDSDVLAPWERYMTVEVDDRVMMVDYEDRVMRVSA